MHVNRSLTRTGAARTRKLGLLLSAVGLLAVPAAHAATPVPGAARLSGSTVQTAAVPVGGKINDVAHLAGGYQPDGTISFALYGPFSSAATVSCAGPNLYPGAPVPVSGDGDYPSAGYTASAPGLYQWVAAYSGDANNNLVTDICGDTSEAITVAQQVLTGRAYDILAQVSVAGRPPLKVGPVNDSGPISTTASSTTPPAPGCIRPLHLGVVTAKVLCSQVTTDAVYPAKSRASAYVARGVIDTGLPGVPVITFDAIDASSRATCATGSTGTATVLNLTIGGRPVVAGEPAPNTVIALPAGIGSITLNEHLPVPGGLRVNALHLHLNAFLAAADVIVASATSDIHNCP